MGLSLVIPCYNADYHLLHNLLDEFSKQTKAPNEIIVSSSGLKEPIDAPPPKNVTIAGESVPVIHVNSKKRLYAGAARNRGADVVNSQLIMFFDVDDIPHPQKIELTLKIFSKNNMNAFVHSFTGPHHSVNRSMDHSHIESTPLYTVTRKNPTCTNVSSNCPQGVDHAIHHGHVTVEKFLFKSVMFNETPEFNKGQDGKFCQDLVDNGADFMHSPVKLVHYK